MTNYLFELTNKKYSHLQAMKRILHGDSVAWSNKSNLCKIISEFLGNFPNEKK